MQLPITVPLFRSWTTAIEITVGTLATIFLTFIAVQLAVTWWVVKMATTKISPTDVIPPDEDILSMGDPDPVQEHLTHVWMAPTSKTVFHTHENCSYLHEHTAKVVNLCDRCRRR